jgi:hypothetical protein
MRVGGQRHAPAALPPGESRYPLYRRLGEPQCRSWRVRKISPPPGFDPRTVHKACNKAYDFSRRHFQDIYHWTDTSVTSDKVLCAVTFLFPYFSFSVLCHNFLFSIYSLHEIKYTSESKQDNLWACGLNPGYGCTVVSFLIFPLTAEITHFPKYQTR